MNECESCHRVGLSTCGCPGPITDTRMILVSINAGAGRKVSRFVLANKIDGRYFISKDTWDRMLDKIGVQIGEGITT